MKILSELKSKQVSRRSFIGFGALVAGGCAVASVAPASAAILAPTRGEEFTGARRITFRNSHTGEIFSGVYRVGDKYLPEAFDQINIVLRDYRSNEVFPMDPRVMDIIYTVRQMSRQTEPYEVLSGYRCPKTNKMLRTTGEGVAKNSLHMTGQAIDLRMPGYDTRQIRNLAVSLQAGGVGYYPKSNFVHMDSGDVRKW